MKKFLSLLLALTMVMSLVVVPARATEPDPTAISVASTATVTRGSNITITATAPTSALNNSSETKAYTELITAGYTKGTETWNWSAADNKVTLSGQTTNAVAVAGVTAGSATLTCNYAVTFTKAADTENNTPADTINVSKSATVTVTVNDAALATDISYIVFNGRSYPVTNGQTATVSYVAGELTDSATWGVTASGSYTASIKEGFTRPTSGASVTVPVTVKSSSNDAITADANITVTLSEVAVPTYNITSPNSNACVAGQDVVFAVSAPASLPTGASYVWTYKVKTATTAAVPLTGTQSGQNFTFKAPSTPGDYTIFCAIKLGSNAVTGTGAGVPIKVNKDNLTAKVVAPATAGSKYLNGSSVPYSFSFKDYTNSAAPTDIDLRSTDITWAVTGGGATFATTKPKGGNGTASNTLTLGSIAGNVTVTATFTYLGKNYTVTFPAITNVVPTYTLGSTYCGYNNSSYIPSTLVSYANSALSAAGITGVTAGSVALSSASGNVVTAAGTAASGYTLTASATYLGTAELTATVTKAGGGTFTMTFKVPVLPIPYSTSVIGTAYAEPYTTGSNYYYNTYRVTLPSTFNQYSVVSKNTSPNYNVSSAPTSGVTTVTLNQNEFVNGQCTLYVIAWNSNYNGYGYGYNYGTNYYGKYYSGAITVYQNSNDIEYTGVAGSTVNFAHSSFTAFMNSMNTASSSYYYQFEDVTFDYFSNSTQGTLYYGSTAMTSGSYSSSSYFNSATKITNLDNVSFAINSRIPSTVKEIVVPFKLHAKQYYNNNTYGTAVTFSGRVVISVAREDIIINVAAGDTVKLDASAFLSYLRASSTAYRNSNIDYVTFDQNISNSSNSSLVNGALYTYYTNSYSFGSAVKSSDRFYYSSTAYNVSNLSDVAFRSNAYATAGTTVYIPFTIKLLNSNATVSGTLAAKISAAVNFYDVKASDYYYDAVKWAVGQGVTKGTGNNMFSPSKGCTRAEIVTFLWRAAGSKAPKSYSNRFTDVSSGMGSDFYNAILWAVGEGITTGTSTTTFSPNATCTRGQIVTFLHRYQKTPGGYYANSFKDVKSGDYCYNAVIWAYGSGVAKGTSNTTFSPNKTCTRGDAVTFLYRAIVK